MTLAEVVKQYRTEHDMSQRTFAKLAKMSNTSLKNIEDGVTVAPRVDSLKNIASAMGISLKVCSQKCSHNFDSVPKSSL